MYLSRTAKYVRAMLIITACLNKLDIFQDFLQRKLLFAKPKIIRKKSFTPESH